MPGFFYAACEAYPCVSLFMLMWQPYSSIYCPSSKVTVADFPLSTVPSEKTESSVCLESENIT